MEEIEKGNRRFGLVGKNISYSFSKGYFTEKFKTLNLDNCSYENFDIEEIEKFSTVLKEQNIAGLNVTIPYKEAIIPFLDAMHGDARAIGAVNTITFTPEGTIGHNTDAYGFRNSLDPILKEHHKNALILGTGGASKAIVFVLSELNIGYTYVSRNPLKGQLRYSDLNNEILKTHSIIINCSPVGTHPNIHEKPSLPYHLISPKHLLFDLIYNPSETAFLAEGKKQGALVQNGLPMLQFQAEKAWEIWNA
ncbi:MAG: shikimate dehydrogenase family protein [Croceivirga sp.]